MWGHMNDFGYYMGGIGMFIWPIILILIIVYVFKNNNSEQYFKKEETPLDILKKRYAKGEISKEEFDEMKNNLK
jgi:putative membrane protein